MLWNLDCRKLHILEKELEELSAFHRLAFAASIGERLLPNYSAFAKEEGFDNPIVLRAGLDEVWQIIQGKPINIQKVRQLIQDCENLPPTEDDDGRYMYEASMTRAGIVYILSASLEPTSQNIAEIARLVGDLIFETIIIEYEIANPGVSWNHKKSLDEQLKDVANHSYWLREIAKENIDL